MSLNGDVVVLRNGRATSQISVYNYPEHLNPFYEDDQHKRLRFWHINKNGADECRRSSFSLTSLKDVWAFKSFRLRKKSSTLGINKTSESPPPLRREFQYDISKDNFDRNASYRSSLQNVLSAKENRSATAFNRNEQYRRTIQSFNATSYSQEASTVHRYKSRFIYGGSVTPQPQRSSEFCRNNLGETLTHGSSQTIVASTNPFDTESEADNEDTLQSKPNQTTSIITKKALHKKRRAPAPPILVHNERYTAETITLVESCENQLPQHQQNTEENLEYSNLTAEIEAFVHTTNENSPVKEVFHKNHEDPKSKIELTVSDNTIQEEQTHLTKLNISQKLKERIDQQYHESNIELEAGHVECIHVHVDSPRATPERSESCKLKSFQSHQSHAPEKITAQTSFTLSSSPGQQTNVHEIYELKITEDELQAIEEATNLTKPTTATISNMEYRRHTYKSSKNGNSEIPLASANPTIKNNVDSSPLDKIAGNHKSSAQTQKVSENQCMKTKNSFIPLKIVEPSFSTETRTVISSSIPMYTKDSSSNVSNEFGSLFREKQTFHKEWKKSTLAPLEANVPPEKRRSVKDIIESINRSQRLLNAAANREYSTHYITTNTWSNEEYKHSENVLAEQKQLTRFQTLPEKNNNIDESRMRLDEQEKEVKHSFQESENSVYLHNSQSNEANDDFPSGSNCNHNDSHKLNNAEIFKKCHINKEIYHERESSPTALNLDWNPLPKPRRIKNL